MGEKPSFFESWRWKIIANIIYIIIYIPAIILYWGKGKTVPPVKNDLLLKSATELAAEIRTGKLKSEDVIHAYIGRIMEVEPYINAVVEHRFEEAIEAAKVVDALVASGELSLSRLEEEKPLLGVPFTVKLLIPVEGLTLSAGSALLKNEKAAKDAQVVAQLKKAGAIFLATTNIPPFGFAAETYNHIYGITRNPYDTHRTPGGSSGGESALIAAAASVIGLGNDLGGSLRIPAHCTSVFAHKASRGIVSNEGIMEYVTPETKSLLYTGPMTRYPQDLVTLMKVLTANNKDKMQFNQPVDFRKLKIYYQVSIKDPRAKPVSEEIQWAIRRAARYFRDEYGILPQEVDIKLLNFSSYIFFHNSMHIMKSIPGELCAGKVKKWSTMREFFKYIMGKSELTFSTIIHFYMSKCPLLFKKRDVPLNQQRLQILKDEFDQLLDENSVFFYPTAPSSATRHFEMIALFLNCSFTAIFNVLGLPVTQCPLGLNKNSLPQGMQIVGKMNNDPLTLACAKELSRAFGGWIPPS